MSGCHNSQWIYTSSFYEETISATSDPVALQEVYFYRFLWSVASVVIRVRGGVYVEWSTVSFSYHIRCLERYNNNNNKNSVLTALRLLTAMDFKYIWKWWDYQVLWENDFKAKVLSHDLSVLFVKWDVKEPPTAREELWLMFPVLWFDRKGQENWRLPLRITCLQDEDS